MKNTKQSSARRRTADLLNRRLATYSTTAVAALATAPMASANIRNITEFSYDHGMSFTPTPPVYNYSINGTTPVSFAPVTSALYLFGVPDFGGYYVPAGSPIGAPLNGPAHALLFNAPLAVSGQSVLYNTPMAVNLGFGDTIAGLSFISSTSAAALIAARSTQGSFASGNFLSSGESAVKTGYVGFRVGMSYYGWLRVKVTNDSAGLPSQIALVDKDGDGIYGAVGSFSDNITAGETAASAIPEPASVAAGLGLFALGAVGVREFRRRKRAAV